MASNYTSNYGLCQWQASDKVLRTEFNADNAKIDAALAGLERSKASASALSSLKTAVNGKADSSTVTSLSSTVSSLNCRVYMETYVGDGQSTKTFSFPTMPWIIFFHRQEGYVTMLPRGAAWPAGSGSLTHMYCTWSGNSVTVSDAPNHINSKDDKFILVAFLEP